MSRNLRFDIGIFDEAHKTAGREGAKFSFALNNENLPIHKRLFLTATPRHYDLKRRDAEGEPVEVYSMNRPEIYGPVVHTLSFAEAAKQKIICNYKVVISVVTSDMLSHPAPNTRRRAGGRQPPDSPNPPDVLNPSNRPRANAHRLASSVVDGNFQQAMRHGTVLVMGGPISLCVDRQDRVWVSATNNRVQQFTNDGKYLRGIGGEGSDPGQFHLPHGIVLDSRDCLYVADTMNTRIQKFAVGGSQRRAALARITDGGR